MLDIDQSNLKKLREHLPIKLTAAIKLLAQCNNDFEQACSLFKTEQCQLLAIKLGLDATQAKGLLEPLNYHFEHAVTTFLQQSKSATQLVLEKSYSVEQQLEKIAVIVEQYFSLERNYWLSIEQIEALPYWARPLLVMQEWLNYESWEGFDAALVCDLFRMVLPTLKQLELNQFAILLEQAHNYELQQITVAKQQLAMQGYYSPDSISQNFEKIAQHYKEQLNGALLDFIKQHINCFP